MENLSTEGSTDNLKIEFKQLTEEERNRISNYIGKCRSCTNEGPFTVHNRAKFIDYGTVSVVVAVHCRCGQYYSMKSQKRNEDEQLMQHWELTLL